MGVHITSISRALVTLVEKDYLEKNEKGYRLIVPVYKTLLKTQQRGRLLEN
jgi:DNA-binding IclR family transcriptional regulator